MAFTILILLALSLADIKLADASKPETVKAFGVLLSAVIASLSIDLLISNFSVLSVLICLISGFRIVNILRLIHGKKQRDYLVNIYLKTAKSLGGYFIYLIVLSLVIYFSGLSNSGLVICLVVLQFIGALVIAFSLIRSYKKTSLAKGKYFVKSSDLPSLTVALPARNETLDLEQCLDSLVGSDYPKLEILVLDDCSQTKHTPEIIKRYAQAGVVFVEGKEPSESWTAKNYAYEQLSETASSDLILFCGVDVRFKKDSLRLMVEVLESKKKKMISFMPKNSGSGMTMIQKLAVQPWRYFWELSLPRKTLKRPPVLSTCWIIYADELKKLGGFKGVSRNILPERYFARQIVKSDKEAYSFMRVLGSQLDFTCQKDYISELSTAKRTLYPMVGSQMEQALITSLLKLSVLVLPFCLCIYGLISRDWFIAAVSFINYLICALCYSFVVKLTYDENIYLSILFMPALALFDIYELLNSMYAYEFNEVIWKDRDVCIPLMRATKT